MVGIKPDEISAILKQQLSGFSSETELEEVGTVLQVGDGIARVYGLSQAQAGELVKFENNVEENERMKNNTGAVKYEELRNEKLLLEKEVIVLRNRTVDLELEC